MQLPNAITSALSEYLDFYLNKSYVELGWLKSVAGAIRLRLGYPCSAQHQQQIKQDLESILRQKGIDIPCEVVVKVSAHEIATKVKPQRGVKNVIAVGSGKGGVGKSTLAANLAIALQKMGCKTGLLDADIYGPSQPTILGVKQKPKVIDKQFIPLEAHGVHMLSMGCLVDDEQAMIWRGPMVSGALLQLFQESQWPDLDYLILDLPPGTGDIQLTMAQKLPVTGAVVVTTPQDLSLLDAQKAINMFNKVHIPVLGVIENMSTFICPNCQHEEHLFGHEGGQRLAHTLNIPFLGDIPLVKQISDDTESGTPTVLGDNQALAEPFIQAARIMSAQLAARPAQYQLNIQTKVNAS